MADEIENVEGTETPVETPPIETPVTEPPSEKEDFDTRVAAIINRTVEPLQTRVYEQNAEITMLRGELAAAKMVPPKTGIDDEAIAQRLRSANPADVIAAIKDIARQATEPLVEEKTSKVGADAQLGDVLAREEQQVYERFPQLKTEPEFLSRAQQIANNLEKNVGRFPGMLYQAVSTAHSELTLSGKLKTTSAKVLERKPETPPANVGVNTTTNTSGPGKTIIATISKAGYTPQEIRGVETVCKQLGISIEKWYENAKLGDTRLNGEDLTNE